MAAPEQNLAFPLTAFLAPVGTDMPAIDDEPDAFPDGWEILGIDGDKDYEESGVITSLSEGVFDLKGAGSTTVKKRFRTDESNGAVKLNLIDLSPDTAAKVLNDAEVTTTAPSMGVAGSKRFSLTRGQKVAQFAVVLRGVSPVDNDLNMQFEYPKAFVSVNGDVTWNKGVVAAMPVEIQPIVITSDDEPHCEVQTHAAS